jgi:hypothetical protein
MVIGRLRMDLMPDRREPSGTEPHFDFNAVRAYINALMLLQAVFLQGDVVGFFRDLSVSANMLGRNGKKYKNYTR